jgi:opacity protein-like surface antigen
MEEAYSWSYISIIKERNSYMKKLSLLCAGTLALSGVSSQIAAKSAFDGGYFGAGYSRTMSDHKMGIAAASRKGKNNVNQFSLIAGYGQTISMGDVPLYIGVEGSALFGKNKTHKRIGGHRSESSTSIPIEAALRVGFPLLDDSLLVFGKGGVVFKSIDHKVQALRGAGDNGRIDLRKPFSNKSGIITPMLGAGLSYAVTDNWQINGEYIWHSQQKGSEKAFNPGHPARAINCSHKVSSHRFEVSVRYKI